MFIPDSTLMHMYIHVCYISGMLSGSWNVVMTDSIATTWCIPCVHNNGKEHVPRNMQSCLHHAEYTTLHIVIKD